MIVRDKRGEPKTPSEKLKREVALFASAQSEQKISSEIFAEQVAGLICENAFCITENIGNEITVELLNGQIFKLTVE